MTSTTIVRPPNPELRAALRLAAGFSLAKLLLHFVLTLWSEHLGYGYFRDEFYYIACGRHLAFGYVDHGPIVALQSRIGELLFGQSVFSIRVLSELAGAAGVLLTGVLAWALGGRRPAQVLAMLAFIVTPQFLGVDSYLSMNSFEAPLWTACVLALVLLLRGYSPRRCWILIGVCAGFGLLNKPSMAVFLIALAFGLLCTPQRRLLFTRHAALGIVLVLVIPSPFVLWEVQHHFPMLEFLRNGRLHNKNVQLGPFAFFIDQVGMMHPLNAFLWVTGVVSLLRARTVRDCRWLGLAYPFFFTMMLLSHAKNYYLSPVYPAFFAAGALAWEHRFRNSGLVRRNRAFAFPVYESLLLLTGIILLPLSIPVLRPDTWVRYTQAIHIHPGNTETAKTGPLPQFFADRFGWQEQVSTVVAAFRSLSPEDQRRVCIYGGNYGEAGAVDFLGQQQDQRLPPAISGHNNYWVWGTHGCNANLVISITDASPEELHKRYRSVTPLGRTDNLWAMPFEHKTIYLLRDRLPSAPFDWEALKEYI